jgi:hypothetical protein
VYFAVRPLWIRFSDFARTPAFIREFTFAAYGDSIGPHHESSA